MYRRFVFEGEIHQSLSCVPLAVRRKLDVAGLKISLAGWQALSRAERLGLCHLPIANDDEVAVYREVMRGFCDGHGVALTTLDDPQAHSRVWNSVQMPAAVAARVAATGGSLDQAAWHALDEDSRYGLLKMAEPKQSPAKFQAILAELGFLPALAESEARAAQACERAE